MPHKFHLYLIIIIIYTKTKLSYIIKCFKVVKSSYLLSKAVKKENIIYNKTGHLNVVSSSDFKYIGYRVHRENFTRPRIF